MALAIQGVPNCSANLNLTTDQVEQKYGQQIDSTLRITFGFESFRANQRNIVISYLGGCDVFALMPTGGGKSLGFQLPALIFPGLTVVVSPLKALMENQVHALKSQKISANLVSSSQSPKEREKVMLDLKSKLPVTKLLYVTPELIQTKFMDTLKNLYSGGLLSGFVIDEAHAISTWGHDFRPAYVALSCLKKNFPTIPIMACTATATDKVQSDIIKILSLQNPKVFVTSFNRPNISYEIRFKETIDNVEKHILDTVKSFVNNKQPSGIVYCHRRQDCDMISQLLVQHGIKASPYHAGVADKERESTLIKWVGEEIDVVVATIAFGMGIDNPRVRYVIHYTMPKSLEDFYQESGRAGRDGKPSVSIMYYSQSDKSYRRFLIRKDYPPGVDPSDEGSVSFKNLPSDIKFKYAKIKHQETAFQKFVEFCESRTCRRKTILNYFGEKMSTSDIHSVCRSTCDCCKDPGRVQNELEMSLSANLINNGWRYSDIANGPNDGLSPDTYDPMAYEGHSVEVSCPKKPPTKKEKTIIYRIDPDEVDDFREELKRKEREEEKQEKKRMGKMSYLERFEAGLNHSSGFCLASLARKPALKSPPAQTSTSSFPPKKVNGTLDAYIYHQHKESTSEGKPIIDLPTNISKKASPMIAKPANHLSKPSHAIYRPLIKKSAAQTAKPPEVVDLDPPLSEPPSKRHKFGDPLE